MAGRIYNHPILKERRRDLRRTSTESEVILWNALRNHKLENRKFRRQFSVGGYILDFYCPAEKLAIELDGAHHFTPEGIKADVERDLFLDGLFIRVLRFENFEVEENLELVLEKIRNAFQPSLTPEVSNTPPPTPSLAKEGARWPGGKKKNDNGEVES